MNIGVGKREGMKNFFKWGRGDENLDWVGGAVDFSVSFFEIVVASMRGWGYS